MNEQHQYTDLLKVIQQDLTLIQTCLDDAFEMVKELRDKLETKIRRRRFTGSCQVIRLDDRKVGGATR